MAKKSRKDLRQRRHARLRRRVAGTAAVPRFAVFSSGRHLYVQLIDDQLGHTVAACATVEAQLRSDNVHANVDGAKAVGRLAAERALAVGVKKVVFDRGGFKYHGRVQAIADAAREAGLQF